MRNLSELYARYTKDGRVQTLHEHLESVAILSNSFASIFGAGELARVAASFHDYGKATVEFQRYLLNPDAKRGGVVHSVIGAQRAYDALSSALPIAELIANVVLSHHGALDDFLDPSSGATLVAKLAKSAKPAFDYHQLSGISIDIKDLTPLASELKSIIDLMPQQERAFAVSMIVKFVYSCLIDADRLDSYLFESQQTYDNFREREELRADWGLLLKMLEESISGFDSDSGIAAIRRSVSNQCAANGIRSRGIYKLEVPTGGGKTLSSLRFALVHAKEHNLDRIIYVLPYLSILSQTADSIRKALGVDKEMILEHHSNFLPDDPEYYKLHVGRWDKPIILTTQVQFLESLFSAKGSDLRKLHNITNSVIIFDEIQTIPTKCIHIFNHALNFLHRVCGNTVLFCTATQPLLDIVERPITFSDNASIATCEKIPQRTKIINALTLKGYSYPEVARFILDRHGISSLVIVNTKKAAKSLYFELNGCGLPIVHLSTNMCPAHRDFEINRLRKCLDERESVICISTQLIEAGVDISFECVIRDIAGLDSVFQAAGRCNRHGEFGEPKNVYVVNIAGEILEKLPDIKKGAEITRRLFNDENIDINTYYAHYYCAQKGEMDYPIGKGRSGTIYDLLSGNEQGRAAYCDHMSSQKVELCSAIRSASDAFYVIAPGQTEVVVPYGKSLTLLDEYLQTDDVVKRSRLLRQLGRYCVSMYKFQVEALDKRGALTVQDGVTVLANGFYDKTIGVDLNGNFEFLCI